jgi:hypothetical protein
MPVGIEPQTARFEVRILGGGALSLSGVYTVYCVHRFLYIMLFNNHAYDKLMD